MDKSQKIGFGAAVALVIISLAICGIWVLKESSKYDAIRAQYIEQYQTLNAELTALTAEPDEEEKTEAVTQRTYCAQELGEKVASLQNEWRGLNDEDKAREVAEKLDACFVSSESNGTVPWFDYAGKWEFKTIAESTEDSFPVLWLCGDRDIIYAYARATYNGQDGVFEDVEYKATQIGMSYVPATDYGTVSSEPDVAGVMELFGIVGVAMPTPEPTTEPSSSNPSGTTSAIINPNDNGEYGVPDDSDEYWRLHQDDIPTPTPSVAPSSTVSERSEAHE